MDEKGAILEKIDHIGIVVKDLDKAIRVFSEALGLTVRTIQVLEEYQAKISEKRMKSKRRKTRREKKLQEIEDERLFNKSREIRVMKTKLITGNTREGIREWIKTQHYDLKRTIHDIADDLGMSIFTVKNLLREIEDQEK